MSKTQGLFKKRIVGLTVVTATVGALVAGLVRNDVAPIQAHRTTYKGISEVADNSNSNSDVVKPFVILEIVGDKDDASIGYLVGGEEPIYDGLSLRDMPVAEEREEKWAEFKSNIDEHQKLLDELTGALTYDLESYEEGTGDKLLSIKGVFQEKENGDYTPKDPSLTYIPMKNSSNPTYREIAKDITQIYEGGNSYGIVLYNKVIEFNTAYGSGIDITLRKADYDDVMPKLMQGSYSAGNDVYNGQYFEAKVINDDTGLYEESMVFVAEGERLKYYGKIANDEGYTPDRMPENTQDQDADGGTPEGDDNNQTDPDGNEAGSNETGEEGEPGETPDGNGTSGESPDGDGDTNGDGDLDGNEDPDNGDTTTPEEPLISGGNSKFVCIRPDGSQVQLGSLRVGSYYRVMESNNADLYEDYYIIDSFTESASGAFGKKIYFKAVSGSLYGSYNAPADRTYYLNEMGSDEFNYTKGAGTHDFITDYSRPEVTFFNYKGGFTNNEWFKQYVLDRTSDEEYASTNVDVVTVTLDELTQELIEKAGLVYLHVKPEYNVDISQEFANLILNGASSRTLPVMLETSSFTANSADDLKDDNNPRIVLNRLLTLLMQKNSIPTATGNWDSEDWENRYKGIYDGYWTENDDCYDKSHVLGTVFVNDDAYSPQNFEIHGPNKPIVADDFYKPYANTNKASISFEAIRVFNQKEEEKIKYLFEEAGWQSFDQSISKATSIRYIINAGKSYNETKSKLNILDLEPYQSDNFTDEELGAYGKYTESEIYGIVENTIARELLWNPNLDEAKRREELNNHFKNAKKSVYIEDSTKDKLTKSWFVSNIGVDYNVDAVNIEEIGTHEFVGRNDNLNETYDMIYIGMDTTIMNTDSNNYTVKTDNTIYMDSSMNGLVYTHVGDDVDFDASVRDRGYTGHYRMTGADITLDKYNALKKYIQTGYAVLLSDEFFLNKVGEAVAINTNKVDVASNMYRLINEVVLEKDGDTYKYYGKNVNRRSAFMDTTKGYQEARESFNNFLSISKLDIEVVSLPKAWAPKGEYLERSADGLYHLDYTVTLTAGTSKVDSSDTYTCKLYVDSDNDGKFEDASISNGTSEEVGVYIVDDKGTYVSRDALKAGNTYNIQATLEEEYVGFISWRLVFLQNNLGIDNSSYYTKDIRVSLSGFSAVPAGDNRPDIKVLEIYSPTHIGNTFKLNSPQMAEKYKQVKDFNITVDMINIKDFVDKSIIAHDEGGVVPGEGIPFTADMSHIEFLNQYDMLVLGFTDNYSVYSNNDDTDKVKADSDKLEAIKAIREYTLSGKSVLLTHDLTSVETPEQGPNASWFNLYMRDILGQDRFGITASNLTNKGITEEKYKYISRYDNALLRTNTVDSMGFADTILMRCIKVQNEIGYLFPYDKKYWDFDGKWTNNNDIVTMLNEGQVTQYPFVITTKDEPTFIVSPTHPQVYQLNLDTDSSDANNNDDIVVWYTLGSENIDHVGNGKVDNLLKAVPNDARNNYYIYSRGNVFYTGAGHSTVSEDKEQNLFINTLVAAYRSGSQSARVTFLEKPWDDSAEVNSLYMPYDPNMVKAEGEERGDFLLDSVTVNIKAINNSLKDSSLPINIEYYLQYNSEKEGAVDHTLKIGDTYYKKITPQSLYLVSNGEFFEWKSNNEVNNYCIYQIKFSRDEFQSGLNNLKENESTKLFIRVSTGEMEDGEFSTLPEGETMSSITIYSTKLMDLE